MKELVVATRNEKKFEEIKDLLQDISVDISWLREYPQVPKCVESGSSFYDNALIKAETAAKYLNEKMCLGEDSGLCVDFLDGAPGIYSARFAGGDGWDKGNNQKMLNALKDLPQEKRTASYVCRMVLLDGGEIIANIEERCEGWIDFEAKGSFGFGYDPIFVVPEYGKTFAQLGPAVKRKISHRSKATRKLAKYLKGYLE